MDVDVNVYVYLHMYGYVHVPLYLPTSSVKGKKPRKNQGKQNKKARGKTVRERASAHERQCS